MSARWPDLIRAVRPTLVSELGHKVATKVPPQVEQELPFTRLSRGPGSDDGITDRPLLDVETFHSNENDAFDLAETTRQAILAMSGRAVDGALVDTVSTVVGPVEVDYGNPAVVRIVASYRFAFRRTHT